MDKLRDIYLERILKNWAASRQPPAEMRARLLHRAASEISSDRYERFPLGNQPDRLLIWALPITICGVIQPYDNIGISAASRMCA